MMAIVVGIGIYAFTRLVAPKTDVQRKQAWIEYYNAEADSLIKRGFAESIVQGNMMLIKSGRLINNLDPIPTGMPPKVV